jgi:hypothetical protein
VLQIRNRVATFFGRAYPQIAPIIADLRMENLTARDPPSLALPSSPGFGATGRKEHKDFIRQLHERTPTSKAP